MPTKLKTTSINAPFTAYQIERKEEMKHTCQNCRFYNLNKDIKDERGKHECYGHSLICSPICLGYEIEKENNCENFKEKDRTNTDEIEKEWWNKVFTSDKSTDTLVKSMMEREDNRK